MALPGTYEYSEDCRPTVRVTVDGTEVPTISDEEGDVVACETQIRKGGEADITRFSDITVPIEWQGSDVYGEVVGDSFRELTNAPVMVELLDEVTDSYFLVHYGPIMSAGPSQIDGAFRLYVGDYSAYFGRVGLDMEFTGEDRIDFLRTIQNEMDEHEGVPFFPLKTDGTNLELPAEPTSAPTRYYDDDLKGQAAKTLVNFGSSVGDVADSVASGATGLNVEQTWGKAKTKTVFKDHRDTCSDGLNWLCEKAGWRWYCEYDPEEEGPVLVVDRNVDAPHLQGGNLRTSFDRPNGVRILENNALFQLSPRYTFGAYGEKGPNENGIPRVIVEHDKLVERAGRNGRPPMVDVDARGTRETINVAKTRLKNIIDDAAGGEIIATPAPLARPFGTVTAQPACNGKLDRDVPPIRYGIEECIHTAEYPSVKGDKHPRTLLRCGIDCRMSDISVREKGTVSK